MKDKFSSIAWLARVTMPLGLFVVATHIVFAGYILFLCWIIGLVLTAACFLRLKNNPILLHHAIAGVLMNILLM